MDGCGAGDGRPQVHIYTRIYIYIHTYIQPNDVTMDVAHTHTQTNKPKRTHVGDAAGLDDVELVGVLEGVVAPHHGGGPEGPQGVVEGEEVHELRQAVGEHCFVWGGRGGRV